MKLVNKIICMLLVTLMACTIAVIPASAMGSCNFEGPILHEDDPGGSVK